MLTSTSAVAAAILLLASCNNSAENSQTPVSDTQTSLFAPVDQAEASQLLAAAEPFEALTENAATASSGELNILIADAKTAVASMRPHLAGGAGREIDQMITAIDRARDTNDRVGIALSSIEIYRLLVSAVPDGTKIPSEVSLLDYAGFRIQANLAASPPRWEDIDSALLFANAHWAELGPSVTDTALASRFETELNQIANAAEARDTERARIAVVAELDLVDELEQYFSAH